MRSLRISDATNIILIGVGEAVSGIVNLLVVRGMALCATNPKPN